MVALIKRIRYAAAWRSRRAIESMQNFHSGFRGSLKSKQIEKVQVDPRITYPCYKSLDEFIDVERLKSLDFGLKKKVENYLKTEECEQCHTGPFKQNILSQTKPGSKVIALTVSNRAFQYFDLDDPDRWEPSKDADNFSELMDFIDTLPFKATARVIIMADDRGRAVTPHRDHVKTDVKHEFIWFRTNLEKPFSLEDIKSKKKVYVL